MTWKELALAIGLTTPQTFVDIRNGRHNLTPRFVKRILERFPNISGEWLLFGTGNMLLKPEEAAERGAIPLYISKNFSSPFGDIDAATTVNFNTFFKGAEAALRVADNSMTEYPIGAVLMLKKVEDYSLVVPSRIYVIDTEQYCVVRRVQSGDTNNTFKLYASNEERHPDGKLIYEPFAVEKDKVRSIYAVLGYVMSDVTELSAN